MRNGERQPAAGAAVLRGEITIAIRQAVIQELAANGYGRLSIEAVARRAGVGKTAIYRRWPSKLEMVLELVSGTASQRMALPDTGSLRNDLLMFLQLARLALQHPLASRIIPDLLAEAARDPRIDQTLREAIEVNLREVVALLISRAVARGELNGEIDPELANDLIVGPLYWRFAVARTAPSADYLPRLAVRLAAAITAADRPIQIS